MVRVIFRRLLMPGAYRYVFCFLLLAGCLGSGETTTPSSITPLTGTVSYSTSAYSGVAFATQPSVQLDQSVSDSVQLAAYTDSTCSTAATGTLSATANPVSINGKQGSFSGVSYTLPSALESRIY